MVNANVQQLLDSASGPNLPTLASSDPQLRMPEKQSIPSVPERQPVRRSRFIGIISGLIILVLVVLLAGGGFLLYSSHQSNNNSVSLTQTASAGNLLTATKTASITGTPTKTQQNGLYIAGTYNGAMNDQTKQQTSQVTVLLVQTQGNGALSGTFRFRSPNQASYPLNGTVDLQGTFSFSVQQPNGQVPLFFHGQVQQSQQDIFLKGNFCSSATNSCSTDTGFFTVGPKF